MKEEPSILKGTYLSLSYFPATILISITNLLGDY